MKLRLAPATTSFVATLATASPHAVLLIGPSGVGLGTIASHIAATNGSLLVRITPESKSTALPTISVDRIRQLYVETKTRLNGSYFVIIDDADSMNHTAQNALLKLLEEPNDSIHFILTSHTPDKLLPTIRSRTQMFAVPPISLLDSKRLLASLGVTDTQAEQRLLYVASGLPAELCRLAGDANDFKSLAERVQLARQLIQGTPYQRIALMSSFSADRQEAIKYIETVVMLLRRSLTSSPDRSTLSFIDRMIAAAEAIRANGNIKLHLSVAVL